MKNLKLILLVAILSQSIPISSQGIFNSELGCVTDPNKECVPNTILTAVPFLRINPDARSSGMGNVGIATSTDPNSMFHNISKLAFASHELGASASYSPWLRGLGLTDVYLMNLSAYKRINPIQSIGFDLKYFSLGDINFTNFNGDPIGNGKPAELTINFGYARKLSENFSTGLGIKYVNSNLASGQSVGGSDIITGRAIAADISFSYKQEIGQNDLSIGTSISNLGSKMSYNRNSIYRDFLPSNIGLGTTYKMYLDEFNSLALSIDLNKLLVPSPIAPRIEDGTSTGVLNPEYDSNGNGIADYRERSSFEGVFRSFGDAQGGLSEELQEIEFSFGAEYWYDNQFAVRAGYYHQSFIKGDRKYLTVGLGINYYVFGLDLSYLVPTNNHRNPLDNTLRFSLNFNFDNKSSDTL